MSDDASYVYVGAPSKDDITRFLEVFDTLDKFEANHRSIRKHGAFRESELPIPEVQRVIAWLKETFL